MAVTGSGVTRANFGDLLEPGFREIFFQQYAELPTVYDRVFHVNSSTKHQEYDSSVSGFGQLVETTEGAAVTYEDPLTKAVAYSRKVIRKLPKLRGTLIEIIRRQVREIKKSLKASETVMEASYGIMGQSELYGDI